MAKALTVKSVEALRPGSSRMEVPDGLIAGLYLIIQPSGRKAWAARYRRGGKPCKLTLGSYPLLGLAEAREAARAALHDVAKGADPALAKREVKALPKDTVAAVAKEFLRRHASKTRKAPETDRVFTKEILPLWGRRRMEEITRREVIDLLDGIVDRGSPVQANRVLAVIRKFFNWAMSRDIVKASPAAGVKPPTPETKRERVLSDNEVRWFWRACGDLGWPFAPMLRLLLLTGQRRSEVSGMSRQEISGTRWTIPAARTKNKKAHAITLPEQALAIVQAAPVIAGSVGLVFTTTGDTAPSGYGRAKTRLDQMMLALARDEARGQGADAEAVTIPHWTLHDLRRTAASGMARIGIQLPVIERVLNHVSGSFGGIVGVYQRHSFAEEMARALEMWADFVLDLCRVRA